MIIKILNYDNRAKDLRGGKALQKSAFNTAGHCARYIIGLHLDPEQLAAAKSAGIVADYVTAEHLKSDRIGELYASNLPRGKPAEQADMFAVHAAAAGIKRFRHIIWSHGINEPVDAPMMKEHREIIARVMQIEECPAIGADHQDTDYDHHHEAVVTIDPLDGRLVEFGQGWWKEAAQIAIAVCEYRSGLTPEANRRYAADETGVYHTFSDTKIADADGLIIRDAEGCADRTVVREVHARHREFEAKNYAGDGQEPGSSWSLQRAVTILAEPRLKKARTWLELHRSFARVGLRLVRSPTGADIEAVGFGSWEDRTLASGAVGSEFTLGRLQTRGGLGDFVPAPGDLDIRPFVMPRYNELEDEDEELDLQHRRQTRKNLIEVEKEIKTHNRAQQEAIREAKLGGRHNDKIREQAAKSKRERLNLQSVARRIGIRKQPKNWQRAAHVASQEFFSAFSAGPDDGNTNEKLRRQMKADWEDRNRLYRQQQIAHSNAYFRDGHLFFVETDNLVVLHSRSNEARKDALLLAEKKFGTVKIMAGRRDTAELIALAVELDIKLSPKHDKLAKAHREKLAAGQTHSRLGRHKTRQKALQRLREMRGLRLRDKKLRRIRLGEVGERQRRHFETANAIADEHYRNVYGGPNPDIAAMQIIDKLAQDKLTLSSSRSSADKIRFWDDEKVREAFKDEPHLLLRPITQTALRFMQRVEAQRRLWICHSITSGAGRIENGRFVTKNSSDEWAVKFFQEQSRDPKFQQMLAIAVARPESFANVSPRRPELEVWEALCSGAPPVGNTRQIAAHIIHGMTKREDRRNVLETLTSTSSKQLRYERKLFGGGLLDWPTITSSQTGRSRNHRATGTAARSDKSNER